MGVKNKQKRDYNTLIPAVYGYVSSGTHEYVRFTVDTSVDQILTQKLTCGVAQHYTALHMVKTTLET